MCESIGRGSGRITREELMGGRVTGYLIGGGVIVSGVLGGL